MKITVEQLSFTYPAGVTALRQIDLQIEAGESVAIIGENGAGKTTLARHLNGLLKPSAGRVWIGDWATHQHSVAQLARRVGYAFQNPDDQLFASTVWDEIAFGPRNLGCNAQEVAHRVEVALAQVDLIDEAQQHPYDLQRTQRKFLALAAVLALETPIVILDEPTTGQDAREVTRIGEIMEFLKQAGRSVLTITHDIDFCAEHCPRVIVMSQGQLLGDGPATEILADAEMLARTEVEPPQLVRLAQTLGWSQAPLDPETFLHFLATELSSKGTRPL